MRRKINKQGKYFLSIDVFELPVHIEKLKVGYRGIFSFSLIFIHNYKKIRIAGVDFEDYKQHLAIPSCQHKANNCIKD